MEIKIIDEDNGAPMSERPWGLLGEVAHTSMTRFLVIERNGHIGVTLHPHHGGGLVITHKDFAKRLIKNLPDAKFMGAGYYYPNTDKAEFDSNTCKEVYGFDRPKDEDLQKKILNHIQAYLKAGITMLANENG